MATLTRVRVDERSSSFFRAQIVDQAGDPIDLAMLTVATLTLYDIDTFDPHVSPVAGIINGRDEQDILPAGSPVVTENNVTYEDNGYFQWDLQPEDNIIVTKRRTIERHRAMFHFEWDGGQFNQEIEIEVINLGKPT